MFGELDGSPSERVLAFRDAGRAAGFDAEASDDIELAPWTTLALNARYEPDTKNSMLLDLEAGKPLEHEWISGEIARFGRELGVPTPFHETAHAAPEPFAAGNRPAR